MTQLMRDIQDVRERSYAAIDRKGANPSYLSLLKAGVEIALGVIAEDEARRTKG